MLKVTRRPWNLAGRTHAGASVSETHSGLSCMTPFEFINSFNFINMATVSKVHRK